MTDSFQVEGVSLPGQPRVTIYVFATPEGVVLRFSDGIRNGDMLMPANMAKALAKGLRDEAAKVKGNAWRKN